MMPPRHHCGAITLCELFWKKFKIISLCEYVLLTEKNIYLTVYARMHTHWSLVWLFELLRLYTFL